MAVLIGIPNTLGRQLLQADPANAGESLRNWLRSTDIDNPTELTRISNFLEVSNHLSDMPMPTILAQLALVRSFVARELEQSRRR
ncbi:hypothetical protein OG874_17825 [Nocardia sp. NBC_00565]|uniref:hypothetical protein n=1 Tax=Nocardia sp. NBC_00565 TaxID=2975993 RepID=UPI002E81F21F|nr:hypothetical protein [Nocardia sp. NBC_00565]WUC06849.1 hypothetical protein OG874_17825 [Nocardia sp. NBC_00565]